MAKIVIALIISALSTNIAGCSYSDDRTHVELNNALARPGSHVFAVAVTYMRVQHPTGFLSTFPDGGTWRVLKRKARIYIIDLKSETVTLAAEIDGFGGIPKPKHASIRGWQDRSVYFSLFGYGDNNRGSDHISDKRYLYYRIDAKGEIHRVDQLPNDLISVRNSGPLGDPPFLRLSKGHNEVKVGIDAFPSLAEYMARFWLDEETGEPHLQVGKKTGG